MVLQAKKTARHEAAKRIAGSVGTACLDQIMIINGEWQKDKSNRAKRYANTATHFVN